MWLEKRNGRYYAAWREGRRTRRKALYTDKRASEAKMIEMLRRMEREEVGLADPYELHKKGSLTEHLNDWLETLAKKGRDRKYIEVCELRINKLVKSCGWEHVGEITLNSLRCWIDETPGLANKTKNHYVNTLISFCNWMVKNERMAENPVRHIERLEVEGHEKRARRALTEEELGRLLAVIPPEFKLVYTMAVFTGLRRAELEALEWGDLHLDSPRPFIRLRAETTKSHRADTVPLRIDLAHWLQEARNGAQGGEKVFDCVPSIGRHKTWLKRAGIPWMDKDGRRADFHSLRKTLCTWLNKAGVPVQTAMAVMRHTDIRLTTQTYNDPRLFDMSGAVERLPEIWPNPDREGELKMGTDDLSEPVESEGDDFRVANRVANAPPNRQKPALTGTVGENGKTAFGRGVEGGKHGLALTGIEEKVTPRVGLEPTT